MNKPQVTVLIANHNYGKYLVDALDSCFKQTYQPLQICIINDCCTDSSLKICDALFKDVQHQFGQLAENIDIKIGIVHNNKIVVINSNIQLGPSLARNIGIDVTNSDTDIYAILDADDYMYPAKIEKCANKLLSNEAISTVYADYDIFNVETSNLIREYKEPFSYRRLLQDCIVHSGAVIKKDALLSVKESTGYYDNRMRTCEDYDLWLRLAEKSIIAHLPESLTFVRIHNNNSTNSVSKDIWNKNWALIQQKLKTRRS